MKKKRLRTVAMLYLCAALVVFGVLAGTCFERAKRSELTLRYNYEHAFGELVTAVSELDTALEKSVWATSPALVGSLCTEVFGKAMTAQMSLSALPFSADNLEKTSGFISRVGDYAFSLARTAAAGGSCTQEQLENLRSLSETAGVLADNLKGLRTELQDGKLRFTELARAERTLAATVEAAVPVLNDSMQLIEQEFPEVPSLIYDGPFSEHLSGMAPRALEGMDEVDGEAARKAAAQFLSIPYARVYPAGESAGDLPCYTFGADTEGGGSAFVSVSKQGGQVLSMMSSRPVGSERVPVETAVETAKSFLAAAGYENMEETYHMSQGGIVTVNFAFRQGEVLCYSDLVKVSVALDNGRVCGFEAKGYLMAHCRRELPVPAVDEDSARSAVPASLQVLSTQLALVPSEGKYETLCREFKCEAEDGRHYIIYVDAATGNQHKILILLEDESGALTL